MSNEDDYLWRLKKSCPKTYEILQGPAQACVCSASRDSSRN